MRANSDQKDILSNHCYQERKMKIVEKLKKKLALAFALHEKPVSLFLKSIKGRIFIDVGANYGYYPLLLHRNFDKIYAFEPIQKIFEGLQRNSKKAGNVECIRKAVSNVDRKVVKLTYHGNDGLAETVTLASSFSQMDIDLIKVDAEGAEWAVLEGAEPILARIKSWVVELHDPSRKEELERWFISRGYSIRWLDFAYRGSKTANHIYAWRV
jgi:FkbM family methyltransferase